MAGLDHVVAGLARVAVVGAGYAGMAAATELAARGISVTVFETSRVLGGRGRALETPHGVIDNGQHILIGAYRDTLRLMLQVGAEPKRALLRLPLTLHYPGQLRLAAPRLPAPFHLGLALLGTRGLNWADKLAAIRFMNDLKGSAFRLPEGAADCSVLALLESHRQPDRLRTYLWEPLCVAALNTPVDCASAQVFLNVLRDTLAAERAASDLLLPRVDLGAMFPIPAAAYVTARGGQVIRDNAIRSVTCAGADAQGRDGGFMLVAEDGSRSAHTHVILAVAPYHVRALTEDLPELEPLHRIIGALSFQPIITCYAAYPAHVRLPQAMLGHAGGIMQWLFDRGQLGGPPGLLAAVISARGRHLALSKAELSARIHNEIAGVVPDLPAPLWCQVINEKRATFSCTPGLVRPGSKTPLRGLLLAGDYVAGDYPGTLESAVRSGIAAARSILDETTASQA